MHPELARCKKLSVAILHVFDRYGSGNVGEKDCCASGKDYYTTGKINSLCKYWNEWGKTQWSRNYTDRLQGLKWKPEDWDHLRLVK